MTTLAGYGRFAPFFRNLVKREIRQKYKGSFFGLAWTLVAPGLLVASYWLVFTYVFKVNTIPNYALFLFTGLVVWTFFFGGIQVASSSIVSNANLVKKVRFPREIVPVSAILANGFTAAAMLALALPLCVALSSGSYLPLLALPGLVLLLACLTVGLGLALAGANVYFRDVEHIVGAIGVPWFFITPIFYTFDSLPTPVERLALRAALLRQPDRAVPLVHPRGPVLRLLAGRRGLGLLRHRRPAGARAGHAGVRPPRAGDGRRAVGAAVPSGPPPRPRRRRPASPPAAPRASSPRSDGSPGAATDPRRCCSTRCR